MEITLSSSGTLLVSTPRAAAPIEVRLLGHLAATLDANALRLLAQTPSFASDGESLTAEFREARGTHVVVRVQATAVGPFAFDLELTTTVAAGHDEAGFHQQLDLLLPGGGRRVFLPAIWVDGNPYTAPGAPAAGLGRAWAFRDDRLAWPAAVAWDPAAQTVVALLRRDPATHDTQYPFGRGYRNVGALALDPAECDVGAMGFDQRPDALTLCAHLPFAELPRSYQDKRQLVAPVMGFFRAQTGASWSVAYRVVVAPAADEYAALERVVREGNAVWRTDVSYEGERDVNEIRAAITTHVKSHAFKPRGRRGVAGVFTLVETFGTRPVLPICEPAFTGCAFVHARNLLEHGATTGDTEAVALGEAIFDTWIAHGRRRGVFVDFWCDNLFGVPVNRPFTFEPPWVHPHNPSASTRRVAEAVVALLDAAGLRPGKREWPATAREILTILAGWQLPHGGFARRYRYRDFAPLQADNCGATPNVITALLRGHAARGDDALLAAAVRAGEFVLREMVAPMRFHGSTLDANCEDKEAATGALAALRLLYETTGEARWLDAARRVAWLAVFWISLVDIPFPPGSHLAQWRLRTRGLTHVSTENNHLDVYLFSTPADLRWLADIDDDDVLRQIAWDALLAALQLVPTPGRVLRAQSTDGPDIALPVGLVPEIIQQTLWVYLNRPWIKKQRTWIKGYVDHKTSMWTSASIGHALERMRDQVSAAEWAAHFHE